MPDRSTVTRLLGQWADGDRAALDALMPLVQAELRKTAAAYLARERRGDLVFQPTALVNEAYIQLVEAGAPPRSLLHFYALAAQIMRHLLIDEARRRRRAKRGGGVAPVSIASDLDVRDTALAPDEVLALAEALASLEASDQEASRVFDLYFFGGRTVDEIIGHLGMSRSQVYRAITRAKSQLANGVGDQLR